MDRIVGEILLEKVREWLGLPGSAAAPDPLICAETAGAGLWRPRWW